MTVIRIRILNIMSIIKSIDYIKHLVAVSKKQWVLEAVPEELKIKEMCLIAISNDGQHLEWMPEELYSARWARRVCNGRIKN